ncbi:MAG: hypothetical protein Q8M98_08395 [Candidatus Cloacimonadaceae bacterium]|nr:hypothetical protein [Candidatus Cloacimonadaceae bacterium]
MLRRKVAQDADPAEKKACIEKGGVRRSRPWFYAVRETGIAGS